jgi:hypothetical protein
MNTATEILKLEETAGSNLAKSDFAPCTGCGDPAGVPAWKADMMGDSVFLFEKRKVKWWRLIQRNRYANDCIGVPDILHFCLRCGLLWGRIDPTDANSKVRNSGSERLHQQLGWLPLPKN